MLARAVGPVFQPLAACPDAPGETRQRVDEALILALDMKHVTMERRCPAGPARVMSVRRLMADHGLARPTALLRISRRGRLRSRAF
jgi:hypothetical protein